MKTPLRFGISALLPAVLICAFVTNPLRAEAELEKAFRDALYAEEVKGDLESALKAYQEVGAKFELQRDMAAAALFREGECLRKLGRKDEAIATYKKVLAHYGDKERTAKLSRENLAALGQALPSTGTPETLSAPTEDEAKELARLTALAQNSPDLLDQGYPSPLHDAVEKGHAVVVAWLLGRLPKQTPQTLGSHLKRASLLGHLKICELLADARANISGQGALHSALEGNRLAVARFLLARKVDVNEPGHGSRLPTPMWDAGFGSGDPLQYSFRKVTPLMIAAASSSIPAEFVSELLEAGAKVDSMAEVEGVISGSRAPSAPPRKPTLSYRLTALGIAIAVQDAEKVRLLLEAKADANQVAGEFEATPLLLALTKASEKDAAATADPVVKLLVTAGADWKAQLNTGVTALRITAQRGLSGWLAEGIRAGVDVNAADNSGFTALHAAAKAASPAAVRALAAAGAKTDLSSARPGYAGLTPLSLACQGKRNTEGLETVKALLEGGADPNLGDGSNPRPLHSALNMSFFSQNRWPQAVSLLVEHGARPLDANVFVKPLSETLPLDDAALEAFRIAWKAAYWRDNPRFSHAVWLSQSESAMKMGREPIFHAVLCDESAAGPPSLRDVIGLTEPLVDWSTVTITRQKDGKEEVIPVDVLAMASEAEPKDLPLEWGDVVEAPAAGSQEAAVQTKQRLIRWLDNGTRADIRLQLGHQRFVANADGVHGPVVRIAGRPFVAPSTVMRTAGLAEMFFITEGIRRTQRDGTLGALEQSDVLRHGDILLVRAPDPKPKLSDEALRTGIWFCQNIEGPFWPVPYQLDVVDEKMGPLGGLVAVLLGPHSLPSPSFDWEKATVRFAVEGKEWQEKNLLQAWPTLKLEFGTVVVLPSAERASFEPSAELRDALTKALAVDWKLAIGQQPLISSRWEPRFFRGKTEDGVWVWRDLDPAKVAAPVVPALRDLLVAHPSAADFLHSPIGISFGNGGGSQQADGNNPSRWLTNNYQSLVVRVKEVEKAPSPTRPASRPNAGPGTPGARRVVRPPAVEQ